MFEFIKSSHSHLSEKELLYTILANQHFIINQISKIMSQNEDFTAALNKLDSDITAVAAALAAAVASTPTGALTAEQAAALIARIQGEQTKLEGLVTPTPAA